MSWLRIDDSIKKNGPPLIVALIQDGRIWRVSDACWINIGFYTVHGGHSCHWATHYMPTPPLPVEEPSQRPEKPPSLRFRISRAIKDFLFERCGHDPNPHEAPWCPTCVMDCVMEEGGFREMFDEYEHNPLALAGCGCRACVEERYRPRRHYQPDERDRVEFDELDEVDLAIGEWKDD